jgi:Skp family chaperone for outer membrane proteins
MKKLPSLVLGCLLMCTLHVQAQGTLKVGTVDVRRILQEYNRAKESAEKINDAANQAKKELNDRADAYKKVDDDITDLGKQLESAALSADAKAQKNKERDDKIANKKNLEREITEFQRTRQRQLQEEASRAQEAISKDITDVIQEKAKATNLDLVFDKSGPSINRLPELLFSRDSVDFTNDVIAALNKQGRTSGPAAEKSPSSTTTRASATPKKP